MIERLTLHAIDLRALERTERDGVAAAVGDTASLLDRAASEARESLALVTCHRIELYQVDGPATDLLPPCAAGARIHRTGFDAASHLISVATGLESELVGEPEILGQIAHARRIARQGGMCGSVIETLVAEALRAGRAARATTGIARGPASLGAVAISTIRDRHPGPIERALVIGAGQTGALMAAGLRRIGVGAVDVANRGIERARAIVHHPGRAFGLNELDEALATANVVVTATAAPGIVLDRALLARANADGPIRDRLVIDLAVPRDTDPSIADLPGVTLIDLDQIHRQAAAASQARRRDESAVRAIVARHARSLIARVRAVSAGSTIASARSDVEARRAAIVGRVARNLAPEGRAAVDRATREVAAMLLHGPTIGWRAGSTDAATPTPLASRRERVFRVGTRRSTLARTQTDLVVDLLRQARPGIRVEVVPLSSVGDRLAEAPIREIGGVGAFVSEIERALRDGEIDIAVHSLKDVPAGDRPGLIFGAFPPRADARDTLVWRTDAVESGGATPWPALVPGAIIGTGSPRRAAGIRAVRPDLRVLEIRGNVDTRLTKLDRGDVDGLILAMAGLARLGRLDRASFPLSIEQSTPMVGQGSLAVQCRSDDWIVREALARIDDGETRVCVEAERAFLLAMGAGCELGVGAFARLEDGQLRLRASAADGDRSAIAEVSGSASDAFRLGVVAAAQVIARLAASGAAPLDLTPPVVTR